MYDESTTGLDPVSATVVQEIIRSMHASSECVLDASDTCVPA